MNGAAPDSPMDDPLYVGVARLTRSLHNALRELGLDSRLVRLAGTDIPDACERLDHVVRLGEDAAHRTLDMVEDGRRIADQLRAASEHLRGMPAEGGAALLTNLAAAAESVAAGEARLRATLTVLAQAQEYQDLSGQVIGRVIRLVRDVEAGLIELLVAGGLQSAAHLPISGDGAVGSAEPARSIQPADQADADRLLAGLGF
ncbi:MAG: protein phosphatase CheZ [Nevskia sp.]|nr:protein phosphatase CheZ [Nevskia sp.]